MTLIIKPQVSHKHPSERQPGTWQVDWGTRSRYTNIRHVWYRITAWSWAEAIDIALHYDPVTREWSDPRDLQTRFR